MIVLELAAQSALGFSPSIRVSLKPGYWVLSAPALPLPPLGSLVVSVLYPDGRGEDVRFRAPGTVDGKVGLTLGGADLSVWRVLRVLGGEGSVHRFNTGAKQFELVSRDAADMAGAIRSGLRLPDRSTFEQLYTLRSAQLPSRQAATAPAKKNEAASRKVVSAWAADMDTATVDAPVATIEQLESELHTARRAAELQFQLDGVLTQLDSVERQGEQLRSGVAQLEAVRSALARSRQRLQGMPENLAERLKRVPLERQHYEEQKARIEHELAEVSALDATLDAAEPWRDWRVWVALVVGVVLMTIGAAVGEGFRSVALAAMLPFSWVAMVALRFVDARQRVSRYHTRSHILAGRARKLDADFALEEQAIAQAFKALNVSTADEVQALLEQREKLAAQLAALEKEQAKSSPTPDQSAAAERRTALVSQRDVLQHELEGLSQGYIRDVADIERDLAQRRQGVPAPAPVPVASPPHKPAAKTPAPVDLGMGLVQRAAELVNEELGGFGKALEARLTSYVAALTERRWASAVVAASGVVTVKGEGDVSERDRDLVFLAVRLALVERLVSKHPHAFILEDEFATLLGEVNPLWERMLKHLGTLTQVLRVRGPGQDEEGALRV